MAEKPTAAYILSLIGAILILIGGILTAIAFAWLGTLFVGIPGLEWLGGLFLIIVVVQIIFGIIVLIGAMWINSTDRGKVRNGSIIVLIFSIIGLILGAGFFIGPILGLVGSILGLTWKPTEAPPPPPP
ncbi:MAG: hypothetical protein H3Z53_06535 [archaeon]|nr:hypothetical protein [archaeon]MCP8314012.1 hypothetical protein [archaeon]